MTDQQQPSPTTTKLIIIGAGMASIKLAHTILKAAHPTISIRIIEANSYIGGRMKSMHFEGHSVECGANWISGLDKTFANPVWKLAQDVSLKGHVSDRDDSNHVYAVDVESGSDVTTEYLAAMDRFNECYQGALELASSSNLTPQSDVDMKSILSKCGWKPCSDVEHAAEYNAHEVWSCDGLENLSAAHDLRPNANDVELGHDEMFVEDPRGFNCILDGMVKDIKEWGGEILLNTRVEAVQYRKGDAKVTASDLTNSDGQKMHFHADAIVSTVSLGVLQSNSIEFIPPFPKWKVDALNEIEQFTFSKVFAKFDSVSWLQNEDGVKDQIIFVSDQKHFGKGHYPLWMKYRSAPKGQHLFVCYLGGSEAKRVEALSEVELKLKDEIEDLFGKTFGGASWSRTPERPSKYRPSSVATTDWSRNPNFMGSYSCFTTNCFRNIPESLFSRGLVGSDADVAICDGNETEKTTLYFAGEAFDDLYNGWVQGAYRSGERVAWQILADNGIQINST